MGHGAEILEGEQFTLQVKVQGVAVDWGAQVKGRWSHGTYMQLDVVHVDVGDVRTFSKEEESALEISNPG